MVAEGCSDGGRNSWTTRGGGPACWRLATWMACSLAMSVGRPRRTQLDVVRAATRLWEQDEQDIGYLARLFTSTSLPYKDPGDVRSWGRRNGKLSLTVQPGMVTDENGDPRSLGLPFGTVPRLLLTWMSTEAVRTRSAELILGASLAEFMRQLGLQPSGGKNGTITRLRKQAERLFMATLTMCWEDEEATSGLRLGVATGHRLWKTDSQMATTKSTPKAQLSLFPSAGGKQAFVVLSHEFFTEVIEHPVPLDLGALRTLRGSPLRLDVYAWLTYRMATLRRRTQVPWVALREQFGSSNADTVNGRAQFRKDFLAALREVLLVYRDAHVDVDREGVILSPSRTHVLPKGLHALAAQ
jgi:Plasmid encoded RepA protein